MKIYFAETWMSETVTSVDGTDQSRSITGCTPRSAFIWKTLIMWSIIRMCWVFHYTPLYFHFSPGSADANVQVSAGLLRSCDQRRVTCSEYVCHSATSARFISTSPNFHCNVFGKGSRGSTFKMLCCLFWLSHRKTEAFSIIECALLLGWAESAHSEGQQAESCHQNDNTEIRPLPSCR